jgi:dethiobiotin synthetase
MNIADAPAGRSVFIAGTDTGVGKTRVTVSLLRALCGLRVRAMGMKPVATGARSTPAGLRNADAELIAAAGVAPAAYREVNPYCFADAVSPHIAAERVQTHIELACIRAAHEHLRTQAEIVVIEGAGGWLAPISAQHTMADVALTLRASIVLVVGLRLGCLNHALLSAEAILARGGEFAGWIGSAVDPAFEAASENIASLRQRLPGPQLALLPFMPAPDDDLRHLTNFAAALARIAQGP